MQDKPIFPTVIHIPVRVVTPILVTSTQVRASFLFMSPDRVSIAVFLGIDSNFAMRNHSTSHLSMIYYLTCRRVFCPLDIFHVYIAVS
jgi:hypothetical protein